MYLKLIYILLFVKLTINFEKYINSISQNNTGNLSSGLNSKIRINMINTTCFYVFSENENGSVFLLNFKKNSSMIKHEKFNSTIITNLYSSYLYKLYNNKFIFVGDNDSYIFLMHENGTQIKNFSIPSISEYYYPPIHVSKTNDKNLIILTYLNKYLRGILYFINIKNYKQKIYHTNLRWIKNDINYQCEYFRLIENYICIYSNNNLTLYLDIYSKYGKLNDTFVIMEIARYNFGKTRFLIFEDNNDKFNIKSNIIIVTKISNTLYLIDLEIKLVFPKIFNYSIKNTVEIKDSLGFNSLIKISNTTFLINMGNMAIYFYDISLNYLGSKDYYTISKNISNIYYFDLIPYNNYKNFFLIYGIINITTKDEYIFYINNFTQITCKNISINLNPMEGISFYIDHLIESFDYFEVLIKFFPLEIEENGYLEYNLIKNNNSNEKISNNYKIEFDTFYSNEFYFIFNNLFNNNTINIKYVLIQNIENIYFPGEPCNIKIN